MSSPKAIKKICEDAGVDKSNIKFCTELVKSCEEQEEKKYTRFMLKDESGKPHYLSDFNECFKNSLLFSGGKAQAGEPTGEGAETPELKPEVATPPADVCGKAGLSGAEEASCKNAADACALGDGPYEIVTDVAPITVKTKDKCLELAVKLPKAGYVIKGANKATKPSPKPTPPSPKSDDSSCTTPPAPKEPAAKPPKTPAKPKAFVPPAPAPGGSHICYEPLNENQIKYWVQGYGVTQITGILMCSGKYIGNVTMGQYGDQFHAGPIDRCDDGSFPTLETKYSLDTSVEGAGTLPTDPKKFMTWRCPKKSLIVNKGYKHYYTPKTREAGESDLKQQCKKAKVEEGFYFIEGLDKTGKPLSYWFERGYNEKSDHTETSINSCFSFGIQMEFSAISGISHYHFHPTSGYSNFGSEFPSDTDFDSTIGTALDKYDTRFGFNPKVFDRRVVTTTGVWIMVPNFDVIRSDPSGAKADIGRFEELKSAFFKKIKGKELKHLSRAEQCELFAKEATSKYVTVTFEPF